MTMKLIVSINTCVLTNTSANTATLCCDVVYVEKVPLEWEQRQGGDEVGQLNTHAHTRIKAKITSRGSCVYILPTTLLVRFEHKLLNHKAFTRCPIRPSNTAATSSRHQRRTFRVFSRANVSLKSVSDFINQGLKIGQRNSEM